MPQNLDQKSLGLYFSLFNEIGIIDQLGTSALDQLMPKGLLHTHFTVLNHLIRVEDGRTPLQLANAFQVAKTSMTHTLSGLEKTQLVTLRPNPNDGRSKQVWLTKKGEALRFEIIQNAAPILARSLEGFSVSHIELLVADLVKIRQILDANRQIN